MMARNGKKFSKKFADTGCHVIITTLYIAKKPDVKWGPFNSDNVTFVKMVDCDWFGKLQFLSMIFKVFSMPQDRDEYETR